MLYDNFSFKIDNKSNLTKKASGRVYFPKKLLRLLKKNSSNQESKHTNIMLAQKTWKNIQT